METPTATASTRRGRRRHRRCVRASIRCATVIAMIGFAYGLVTRLARGDGEWDGVGVFDGVDDSFETSASTRRRHRGMDAMDRVRGGRRNVVDGGGDGDGASRGRGDGGNPTRRVDAAHSAFESCGPGATAFGERRCPSEREYPDLDVVSVAVKPSCVNAVAVAALNQYVGPRRIIVVAPGEAQCRLYRAMASNVECHAEDAFVPGVTKAEVAATLEQLYDKGLGDGGARSTYVGRQLGGWYLQQLLKLGASRTTAISNPPLSRKFLIWDLDMIPLRPLDLFTDAGLTGEVKAIRQIGGNVIKSYESSYEALIGNSLSYAKDETSYVTHQMVVDADIMDEMLDAFVTNVVRTMENRLPDWAQAILQSLDKKDLILGFSEYATYASYVAQFHPEAVQDETRKNWARASGGKLGISIQRLINHDGLCCPGPGVLGLMKSRHFDYVGHEIGHVDACRYNAPEHAVSYGLPLRVPASS